VTSYIFTENDTQRDKLYFYC